MIDPKKPGEPSELATHVLAVYEKRFNQGDGPLCSTRSISPSAPAPTRRYGRALSSSDMGELGAV